MESLRHDDGHPDEARSGGTDRLSGQPPKPLSVGELTARQLDLQRRLVRESLLLRSP
jgi:hypothetical protein